MRVGDFKPIFGRNIRYLRACCGLSQATLGRLAGGTGRTIQKIEQAKGTVHLEHRFYCRICQILGVDGSMLIRTDLKAQGYRIPTYLNPNEALVVEMEDFGEEEIG